MGKSAETRGGTEHFGRRVSAAAALGLSALAFWIYGSRFRKDADPPDLDAKRFELREPLSPPQPQEAPRRPGDYRSAYTLAPGEVLKRVGPPFPRDRLDSLKESGDRGGGPVVALIVAQEGERLGPPRAYTGTGDTYDPKGYPLGTLVEILTGEQTSTIDCDPATAAAEVPGDFIYRVGTPAEVLLPKLQEVLRRECELPVTFTFRDVNRETLVARGRYKFRPEPGRPGWIEVYGKTLADTREGVAESGSFAAMLDSAGRFIRPARPIVSEAEGAPRGIIAWHLNPARQDVESQYGETEVLAHLSEQTGLNFTRETRPARLIEIRRSGSGGSMPQDRPRVEP